MIIWVNGTYSVGKTTVAKKIAARFGSEAELLESDYYCNETLKKIVEEAESTHSLPHIGGCLPQNNMRFIQEFKELIKEKSKDTNKKLIIDMALTRMECKENLFDCLQKEGKDIVHIILTADKETIKERIKKDTNRMKDIALEWMVDNIEFLDSNYPDAIRINTNKCDIDDIVDEIIEIIQSKRKLSLLMQLSWK